MLYLILMYASSSSIPVVEITLLYVDRLFSPAQQSGSFLSRIRLVFLPPLSIFHRHVPTPIYSSSTISGSVERWRKLAICLYPCSTLLLTSVQLPKPCSNRVKLGCAWRWTECGGQVTTKNNVLAGCSEHPSVSCRVKVIIIKDAGLTRWRG